MLGGQQKDKKADFLATARAARDERGRQRRREGAATQAQAAARGFLTRRRLLKVALANVDEVFPPPAATANDAPEAALALPVATDAWRVARLFVSHGHPERQTERLERLCRYILASLGSSSPKSSYVSVALARETAVLWIAHLRRLLALCSCRLDTLRLDASAATGRELATLLRMLVAFTSTAGWNILKLKAMEPLRPGMSRLCENFLGHLVTCGLYGHLRRLLLRGLCGPRVLLKKAALSAAVTLALRPAVAADFSDKLLSALLLDILR